MYLIQTMLYTMLQYRLHWFLLLAVENQKLCQVRKQFLVTSACGNNGPREERRNHSKSGGSHAFKGILKCERNKLCYKQGALLIKFLKVGDSSLWAPDPTSMNKDQYKEDDVRIASDRHSMIVLKLTKA